MYTRLSLGLLCGCWIAAGCPSATTSADMFDAAVARDATAAPDASPSPDAAPVFADAAQTSPDAAPDAGPAPSDVGPTPSDAGVPPPGAWQVTSTEQGGVDPATIQRLQLATNRRGDAAFVWELYPNKIKGTTYSAATGRAARRWARSMTWARCSWLRSACRPARTSRSSSARGGACTESAQRTGVAFSAALPSRS